MKNIPLTLTYKPDIVTDSNELFKDIPFTIDFSEIDFSYDHSDATLQLRVQTINDEDTRIQVGFKHSSNSRDCTLTQILLINYVHALDLFSVSITTRKPRNNASFGKN